MAISIKQMDLSTRVSYLLRPIAVFVVAALFIASLCPSSFALQPDQAMQAINSSIGPPFEIDHQRVKDNGIVLVQGKHIDLYSDLRDQPRLSELVEVFDQAIPQWCALFNVQLAQARSWRMRAFLMTTPNDVSRFQKAGLLNNVPVFKAGFQRDHNLWLFAQEGKYYTRHLLLHEGTHAFMQWFKGGYGAPWYSEGMAELVGLHRWDRESKSALQLSYRLKDKSEADYWGRVKIIRDETGQGKGMTLDDVLQIPPNAFRDVRYYAWSWAACEFFSKHPTAKEVFAELKNKTELAPEKFNFDFKEQLKRAESWTTLNDQWELFIKEIDYGYLIERSIPVAAKSLDSSVFAIQSDHSWQMTIRVKKGQRYSISAKGRYSIGNLIGPDEAGQPRAAKYQLASEANGITLAYYRGRPLGELHAGIWSTGEEGPANRTRQLQQSTPIGNRSVIEIESDGILCLRVNESPAKLADNQDALEVLIRQLK